MNVVVAEKQREICRELKNLVAKIEDNIKQEEENYLSLSDANIQRYSHTSHRDLHSIIHTI